MDVIVVYQVKEGDTVQHEAPNRAAAHAWIAKRSAKKTPAVAARRSESPPAKEV